MSLRFAILADDLSGCMNIGGEFSAAGLQTRVCSDSDIPAVFEGGCEVLIVDTGTRSVSPGVAGQRARQAATAVQGLRPDIVVKKIDSLLRGPIGSEIDAVMEVFGFHTCLFVAASPKIGRTTVGGYQLVDGNLLAHERENVAPDSPVGDSFIPAILAPQTRRAVRQLTAGGIGRRSTAIGQMVSTARDVIWVADSVSQPDLNWVVRCALDAGVRFFAGTYGLGEALTAPQLEQDRREQPLLIVAGSLSQPLQRQVARLCSETACPRVAVEFDPTFFEKSTGDYAVPYADQIAGYLGRGCDVVLHVSAHPEQADQMAQWATARGYGQPDLVARLDRLVQDITQPHVGRFRGFIASGGATAAALAQTLGAAGFRLGPHEVFPGVPVAYLVGGACDGLPFVAKPGSQGADDALLRLANHLHAALAAGHWKDA
jgi:uncharacterized protein YgbK (DUF1537 family)